MPLFSPGLAHLDVLSRLVLGVGRRLADGAGHRHGLDGGALAVERKKKKNTLKNERKTYLHFFYRGLTIELISKLI